MDPIKERIQNIIIDHFEELSLNKFGRSVCYPNKR